MRLLKPNWVHHNENSIFSVDVHPDSSRFATGGQGADSGKICIWNMGPVIDSKKENDSNSPKILCTMDHHIACVNVVRWSNNGLFLASGSDDKLVMIWQYAAGGGLSYQNIENWKCGFTLRGHSGDVMDLAWSAKDQYLATCSVDNTVIIWNALKFPDIITRINAHAGLVKGVAWDPAGTYFASQSDDKTLKIWRTLDWSLDKCIDEPFKNCAGTTHVLRCSWSPDGQLVVSAHAMNNGAPTAQVIDRGNKWNTKLDFVGHRKAVTSVRFFPTILKPIDAIKQDSDDIRTHCLFALGSRDRSISIWTTNYSRPLCVIRDIFDNPIVDLSWSKTPNPGLLACSMDGTISYIELDYAEIGYPQTKKENEEFFLKKYNYDINASVGLMASNLNKNQNNIPVQGSATTTTKKDNTIKFVENIDILLAQEQKQLNQTTTLAPINENSMSQYNHSNNSLTPSKLAMLAENKKQVERKMADGRRRITPICVSKPGEYDTPKPFGSESNLDKVGFERSIGFGSPESKFVSRSATEQSTIIVEKRDEKNEIVDCSPVKSIVYSKPFNSGSNHFNNSAHNSKSNEPMVTNNMAITNNNTHLNSVVQNQNTETVFAKKNLDYSSVTFNSVGPSKVQLIPTQIPSQPKPSQKPTSITNKPSVPIVQEGNKTPVRNNNQRQALKPTNVSLTGGHNKVQTSLSLPQSNASPLILNKITDKPKTPLKHHSNEYAVFAQNLLQPLKIDKNFMSKIICEKTSSRNAVSIEIYNSINLVDKEQNNSLNTDLNLSLVKYISDHKLKWQMYFSSKICDVACSSQIVATSCSDSSLHLSKASNGSQICCPILLDSKAAVIKCNTNFCMCLTVNGSMYVWKYKNDSQQHQKTKVKDISDQMSQFGFNNLSTIINAQSCQSILKEGAFINALLTENGIPVIYMSKNRSYFYSYQTRCWHLVPQFGNLVGNDSQLLLNSSSVFAGHNKSLSSLKDASSNPLMGPLSIIQQRDKSSNLLKTIDLMNKTQISENPLFNQQDFTLTHLESQMNASIGLSSSKEYKFWLMTYARYLVENEYEDKLTDLCNFLLGPLYSTNWNETILTFKKRDLLKEILTITAQNIKLQRLYSYYKQQLGLITNLSSNNNNILNRLTAPSASKAFNSNHINKINKLTNLNLLKLNPNGYQNLNKTYEIEVREEEVSTISRKLVDNRNENKTIDNDINMNDDDDAETETNTNSNTQESVKGLQDKTEENIEESDQRSDFCNPLPTSESDISMKATEDNNNDELNESLGKIQENNIESEKSNEVIVKTEKDDEEDVEEESKESSINEKEDLSLVKKEQLDKYETEPVSTSDDNDNDEIISKSENSSNSNNTNESEKLLKNDSKDPQDDDSSKDENNLPKESESNEIEVNNVGN